MVKKFLILFSVIVFMGNILSCKVKGGEKKIDEEIQLPQPKTRGKISLEESILKRHSVRDFSKRILSREQISQLLWAAYGEKHDAKTGATKTVPSAGAAYPMETYLVSSQGFFHYFPQNHKLVKLKNIDLRSSLSKAALRQGCVSSAGVNIVITCVYDRICGRYKKRGIKYAYIEAGHIAQNIHLQAVCLGLSSVAVGAFSDEAVQKVLDLPNDHIPVYIIPVGYPKKK
ncbi:SagB/ThcOx family dehydrogenase [bacterium]|nr:SagB/ThcOx family dehydrogenase [bacterium]